MMNKSVSMKFVAIGLFFNFLSCRALYQNKIGVPGEYAGFKPRAEKQLTLFLDSDLTAIYGRPLNLPNTESAPIRERYQHKDTGPIVLETIVAGTTLYVNEADIYYDYASCSRFSGITVRDLKALKNLLYAGRFKNRIDKRGGGEALSDLYNDKQQFSRSKFDLQIGTAKYGVATFELLAGFCMGRHAIHKILDYIVLPPENAPGDRYLQMCAIEANSQNPSFLIATSYERSKETYLPVERAWYLNRKTQSIEPIDHAALKCKNPCPAGCGP